MSDQSITTQRTPSGLLSAVGVDYTVFMVFLSVSCMIFLILGAVGYQPAVEEKGPETSVADSESVFSDSELPGVDLEIDE